MSTRRINNEQFKIKVQVTLVSTTEPVTTEPLVDADGTVTVIIPESEAGSIDAWDDAVVSAGYEAMRAGLMEHGTCHSLADARSHLAPGQTIEPVKQSYRVEGEAGRFTLTTHRVMAGSRVVYDTARHLFSPLDPKEWYKTRGYKKQALFNGAVDLSLRKTCQQLQQWRHQKDSTPVRTLQDTVEAEGQTIEAALEQKAAAAFEQSGFSADGQPIQPTTPSGIRACLPDTAVDRALTILKQKPDMKVSITPEIEAEIRKNPLLYEDPAHTVNISADDVGAKKQKEQRFGSPLSAKGLKRVHTSVVHIQQGKVDYTLCAAKMKPALRLTTGFLCYNNLTDQQLQFFTDGQKSLKADIFAQFGWAKMSLILDWKHLSDKCANLLSMALKGRKIRNEVLDTIKPWLWLGLVDRAIAEIKKIEPNKIKDSEQFDKLIGYWERNREHIPCYALRKELGLRNSSNRVEKENDLLVSERQKHRGMSWSQVGSSALATLSCIRANYEVTDWLSDGNIRFKMTA